MQFYSTFGTNSNFRRLLFRMKKTTTMCVCVTCMLISHSLTFACRRHAIVNFRENAETRVFVMRSVWRLILTGGGGGEKRRAIRKSQTHS